VRPSTLAALGVMVAVLAWFGTVSYGVWPMASGLHHLAWPALTLAIGGPPALIAWTRLRPRVRDLHCRGRLGLGLCPACAYRIADVRLEEDNCRVCPECGGAWRMDGAISLPPG
jgi:hypothetical protein